MDCNHPSNWLEEAICKQPSAKELYGQLIKAYETALDKSKNPEVIKNEQNMWVQNLLDHQEGIQGRTEDKTLDWYVLEIFESRIAQLKKGDKREKLGDCRDDKISDRFQNEYGDISIYLQSGILIDVFETAIPAEDFKIGYKVKICLKAIAACGHLEESMNKTYSLQSYKDSNNIINGLSSRHLCMSQI